MFERVKKFYDMGLYDDEKVAQFVKKGYLSADQYEEITGKEYDGGL